MWVDLVKIPKPWCPLGQIAKCYSLPCCHPNCACAEKPVCTTTKPIHYSRKATWVRVAGVLACALFLTGITPDWHAAHVVLQGVIEQRNKKLPEDEQQFIGSHDTENLKRWWDHFLTKGSVADDDRSGRPHKVNTADAMEAAQIFKDGKEVTHVHRGQTQVHRVHYTSIGEAIRESPRLKDICSKYSISAEELLHAMHQADPSLVRRKMFFKHAFTPSELEQRRSFASWCTTQEEQYGDLLSNTIFIDESSIVIDKSTKSDVWVWCDKHDLNFTDVRPRKLPKGGHVKLHFIVAVSAHPAFAARGGLVYMDFTTGTTDIQRRHNKIRDGSNMDPAWQYSVSSLHLEDPAVAKCICVIAAVRGQQHKHLQVWQIQTPPPHCSSCVWWCQHNAVAQLCSLQGCCNTVTIADVICVHPHHTPSPLNCCQVLQHIAV